MGRALAGDAARLDALLTEHGAALRRMACAILQDGDEAEDALQEVRLRLLSKAGRYDLQRPVLPLLRRVVVNECLSRLRRRVSYEELDRGLVASEGSPDASYANTETLERVLAAIRSLPPRRRAAITLFSLEGMDLQETAQAMGCRVGTVKAHLFHARLDLKQQLADLLSTEVETR